MEKEFVPYELAVKMKELGFNEKCFSFYNTTMMLVVSEFLFQNSDAKGTEVIAPLWQQAFDWFREVKYIECFIKSKYVEKENKGFYFGIDNYKDRDFYSEPYYSYELSRTACLEKLIESTPNTQHHERRS